MIPVALGGKGWTCGAPTTEFQIAKSETTNSEYARFLNAIASQEDPHSLYLPMMSSHFWGGIIRSGEEGRYLYRPKFGYEDLPVTFVSWFSAVRYANWLHYGSPSTAGPIATEGNGQEGAYDTTTWSRNPDAQYWVPSCAEWRQAAFFDPIAKLTLRFATGDELPEPGSGPAEANYFGGAWAAPFPHLLPANQTSISATGTAGQAGNVLEWVEDAIGPHRMALGGSLLLPPTALDVSYFDSEYPDVAISSIGFRVASRLNPIGQGVPAQAPAAFSRFEFVSVLHVGNPVDPKNGRGRVDYAFDIGKYEITNLEYSDFLNAVASEDDPAGLFSLDMETGVVGGISRERVGDRFRYSAKTGWELRPVTYISWFDLARLANWLHYGMPRTGRSELKTTEGDATTGAYDTTAFPDADGVYDPRNLPVRNPGARYAIPTDDEWYKTAYYNGEVGQYTAYPTKTDTPPPTGSSQSLIGANYTHSKGMGEEGPYFVSNVDSFAASETYFGTRQMAGNVWEWTEDWRSKGEGGCWRCDEWAKGLRGGSFNYTEIGLSRDNVDPGLPELGLFVYGARLARFEDGWRPTGPSVGFQVERLFARISSRVLADPTYTALFGFSAGLLSLGSLLLLVNVGRVWHGRRQRLAPRPNTS